MKSIKVLFYALVCLCSFILLLFLLFENDLKVTSKLPRIRKQKKVGLRRETFVAVDHAEKAHTSTEDLLEIESSVEACIKATNISDSFSLIEDAKSNAKYMFEEYRRLIPERGLAGYSSHCWKESYFIQWNKSSFNGHIGEVPFAGDFKAYSVHAKQFRTHKFNSDLVCLPNLLLTGFPKAGSSFTYCWINRLIFLSLNEERFMQSSKKEPQFWVENNPVQKYSIPTLDQFGRYIFHYISGLWHIAEQNKRSTVLLDGSVNKMFKWPFFEETQNDLTNYCLLPTVMPRLLPQAKFIVITRDPIKLLYSAFWFSCTSRHHHPDRKTQLKGPNEFHDRVMKKLDLFNDCMRNNSVPAISHACKLGSNLSYNGCIQERLHLLDRCAQRINFNLFSPEIPGCGRTRLSMALYAVHIRKWLSALPRDRLLFLTLEELIQYPERTAHDVLKFLNLRTDVILRAETI